MTDVQIEVEFPVICRDQVPGCEACYREAAWRVSNGHTCDETIPDKYISMCDVWGPMRAEDEQFHWFSHQPVKCRRCGSLLWDKASPSREVTRPCRVGNCVEWACPDCGYSGGSGIGPVGCPCQFKDPKISAIRRSYARRRKHW